MNTMDQVPASRPRVLIMIATRVLGGPGKGLLQFIRNMPEDRMSCVLAGFTTNGTETEFARVARSRHIPVHLFRQRRRLDPGLIGQARTLLKARRCNIIQSHGYKTHIMALAVSRLCGVPWVAVAHGWTRENLRIRMLNRLDRLLLRYADVAIAVSPALHATLSAIRGPDRPTELILNAVDPEEIRGERGGEAVRAALGLTPASRVIGVFGRFSPEKGQRHAVDAFARVADRHPRAVLLLVGDGQDAPLLRRRVAHHHLEDRVIFCGYQTAPRDYFEACDLVMLPSLSEGLPNVVLEAMALGRPVLATDVGGVRLVIRHGDTGWIVSPGSSDALAEALHSLLDDGVDLSSFGRTARTSLYPGFAVETRVSRLVKIYEALQERSSRKAREGPLLERSVTSNDETR